MTKAEFVQRVRDMERRLYRVSRTMLSCDADCEDAVQEALLRAWSRMDTLRQPQYFETWLIRILINECRSLMRRQKLRPVLTEPPPAQDETDLQLREALQSLPEKYRMPLLLHHLEGYSLTEVGQMLGLPAGLVKSRLHQARSTLRKLLEEDGDPS